MRQTAVVGHSKMIKKLLNFRKTDTIKNVYFGELEINYDRIDQIFYLERDVILDNLSDSIHLMIASEDKKVTKEQIDLFELIKLNFSTLVKNAYEFICLQFDEQKESLKKKYKIESVVILDGKSSTTSWELNLANQEDGFTYCIIEFEDLNPIHLSIEG